MAENEERPLLKAPQGAVARVGASGLTTEDERLWAALAHASLVLTLIASVASAAALTPLLIFVPLVIYFCFRGRSESVSFHALQAFVMQLVATLGWVIALAVGVALLLIAIVASGILSFVLVGIPFLLLFILTLVLFVVAMVLALPVLGIYSLVAAVETYNGRDFRYVWVADWIDKHIRSDNGA
jgi:uncharacterized membrane protein